MSHRISVGSTKGPTRVINKKTRWVNYWVFELNKQPQQARLGGAGAIISRELPKGLAEMK